MISHACSVQKKMTCPVQLPRKIKFEDDPTSWDHHRGGWSYAFQTLQELYAPDGVLCISAVEEWALKEKCIDEPWIGFVHQVPRSNYFYYPDLERLVMNEFFNKSLSNCYGLFVLSQTVKDYLINHLNKKTPVATVLYPLTPYPKEKEFNWNLFTEGERKIIFIGEFLRNYQAFYDLQVPTGYQKYLLKSADVNFDRLRDCNRQPFKLKINDSVIIKERVSNEEYDNLLSSSIVFLNLYDAPANTTVVECLGRNTPLIVNRLPGIEEYLGVDYPLFYDTLEEATTLLKNAEKLQSAIHFLKESPMKWKLTRESFLQKFTNTAIYRYLPLPPSQQSSSDQIHFPQFDVSVVICAYKRVYNLEYQLECFKNQDFTGTFEVIIWNNNHETQQAVESITAPFMKELNIRLIQSSENYYCIIRLAVVQLVRSNHLLLCDDDIIPKPNYITKFVSKYKEYGPRAVLCCRGHVFTQHEINEEEPEKIWKDYEDIRFFDESKPDREVK